MLDNYMYDFDFVDEKLLNCLVNGIWMKSVTNLYHTSANSNLSIVVSCIFFSSKCKIITVLLIMIYQSLL